MKIVVTAKQVTSSLDSTRNVLASGVAVAVASTLKHFWFYPIEQENRKVETLIGSIEKRNTPGSIDKNSEYAS